jgi:hypothetical protein
MSVANTRPEPIQCPSTMPWSAFYCIIRSGQDESGSRDQLRRRPGTQPGQMQLGHPVHRRILGTSSIRERGVMRRDDYETGFGYSTTAALPVRKVSVRIAATSQHGRKDLRDMVGDGGGFTATIRTACTATAVSALSWTHVGLLGRTLRYWMQPVPGPPSESPFT